MNIEHYTPDELDDLKAQTDSIAANLKYIEKHGSNIDDLEELDRLSSSIATNLRYIEEHDVYSKEDLENLEERTVN
jgi:hypothetical protein